MKKLLSITVLVIASLGLFAQNMVPNPSFETYSACPVGPGELSNAVGWTPPSQTSPDYFNACYTPFPFPIPLPEMDVPQNFFGNEPARTGNGYAGIIAYDNGLLGITNTYREFIQVRLTSPMQAGVTYCAQFYISRGDSCQWAIDEIGMYISTTQTNDPDSTTINVTPQIVSPNGTILTDTSGWTIVEGTYLASGGEQWIIIGHFKNNANADIVNAGAFVSNPPPIFNQRDFAYYYIDDVFVGLNGQCPPPCNAGVTAAGTDASCSANDGTATATPSGGSTYTYLWSNGQFTATATNLAAGTYTVTVTVDGVSSCTASASVTIGTQSAPLANVNITNVNCNGGSDGSATAIVSGGTSPYTYNWGSGNTASNSASNLTEGSYTVTVTDNSGCTTTTLFTINEPASALSITSGGQNVDQGNDGLAWANASGGTPTYTYNWSSGTPTAGGDSIINLSAGTYTVTVTDGNGCTIVSSVTIFDPGAPLSAQIYGSDAGCGGNDGAVWVIVNGGDQPYTYNWSSGTPTTNGDSITGLMGGIYDVTVTDDSGAVVTLSITINGPQNPLTATATTTDADCNGGTNGSLTATASGGTSSYEYSLDGGTYQSSGTFSGLAAGTYTISIKDAAGCITDIQVTVTDASSMVVQYLITPASTDTSHDGGVKIVTTGGASPYQYSIEDSVFSSAGTFTELQAGTYYLTVVDANGCVTVDTFVVPQYTGIHQLGNISGVKVYPNPAVSELNVKFTTQSSNDVTIKLYSILGQEVYRQNVIAASGTIEHKINVSRFSKGIYFLELTSGPEKQYQKLLIGK